MPRGAVAEPALEALEPLGLEPRPAAGVVMTVNSYVRGSVRVVLGEPGHGAETDDPGVNRQRRLHDTDLERYPRLRRLVRSPPPPTAGGWFTDGLDLILGGGQIRRSATGDHGL